MYNFLKRVVDVAAALALALALAPVLLAAMAVVRATSAGPALYRQTRTGRGGRRFTIYKVRSMYHDCERATGPRWSTADDPRVTPVGHVLRQTHLDEIPQLWNVLAGDMSLVGPRPERPEFVVRFEAALPRYADRHRVRPGLTGLAQINLPPDSDFGSVRRKLAYDLDYVDNPDPLRDLKILACTGLFLAGVPFEVSTRWPALRDAGRLASDPVCDPEPTAGEVGAVAAAVGLVTHAVPLGREA